MVKKGWLALSYMSCFFAVYLGSILYSLVPLITKGEQEYTSSFTTSIANSTMTMNAMAFIPGWLPIIIIVIVGALLLGLTSMFNAHD